MKKSLLLLSVITVLFSKSIFAQTAVLANPYPKTITVNGSAEMEVVPDEIFVNITLKEYQKKGESKKNLDMIKEQFFKATRSIGIPDSLITIFSYTGYTNYYDRKKKKNPDMLATITYQVKFKSSNLMDDLVDKLDDDATQGFYIAKTSHSKITEYRKELKMRAIIAAKEKAGYLAGAINENVGDAVTINEPAEYNFSDQVYSNSLGAQYKSVEGKFAGDAEMPDVDFKKIKLRFEVTVVFALK
jgi:uncharacterized protein YggE